MTNTDALLSIRENDIRQDEAILKSAIEQLQRQFVDDAALLSATQDLAEDIKILMQLVLDDENSVFNIRSMQLENNVQLHREQQNSVLKLNSDLRTKRYTHFYDYSIRKKVRVLKMIKISQKHISPRCAKSTFPHLS